MSIRNYYSRQRHHRKNPISPFVRKSNLRIITIFGREFLNNESGRKALSKLQRPETGRASPWGLSCNFSSESEQYRKCKPLKFESITGRGNN